MRYSFQSFIILLQLELVACRVFKARFEDHGYFPNWNTDPESDSDPTLPDPVNSDTNSEPPAVSGN